MWWAVGSLVGGLFCGALIFWLATLRKSPFWIPDHDLSCTESFRLSDSVPYVTVHVYIKDHGWGSSPRSTINTSILTRRCAMALACTNAAFQTLGWRLNEVMIWFSNEPFERRTAGDAFTLEMANQNGSRLMPMIVVRPRCFNEVLDSGEPIIHEVIHELLREHSHGGADEHHAASAVWSHHGPGTRQETARELFQMFVQDERTRKVEW